MLLSIIDSCKKIEVVFNLRTSLLKAGCFLNLQKIGRSGRKRCKGFKEIREILEVLVGNFLVCRASHGTHECSKRRRDDPASLTAYCDFQGKEKETIALN